MKVQMRNCGNKQLLTQIKMPNRITESYQSPALYVCSIGSKHGHVTSHFLLSVLRSFIFICEWYAHGWV